MAKKMAKKVGKRMADGGMADSFMGDKMARGPKSPAMPAAPPPYGDKMMRGPKGPPATNYPGIESPGGKPPIGKPSFGGMPPAGKPGGNVPLGGSTISNTQSNLMSQGNKKPSMTNYPGVERPMSPPALGGGAPSVLPPVNDKFLRPGTPKTPAVMPPPTMTKPMPRPGTPKPPAVMRGGGLAKKGVGMALKKGGLVKGAGCASRGVKKPRYT